jgi:hypothetical protein
VLPLRTDGCAGDACTAQTNMQCWVHQDTLFNDEQVETNMREAWEHEDSKDEMNIVLQGLEQHFWKGTEAGWMGCYEFPAETWAGDGSANKGVMGAGSVCFQRPGRNLVVRVGREEEGASSLRPELAAIARTYKPPQWRLTCFTYATARPPSIRCHDG